MTDMDISVYERWQLQSVLIQQGVLVIFMIMPRTDNPSWIYFCAVSLRLGHRQPWIKETRLLV